MRTLLAATLWLTAAACGSSDPKPASSPPPPPPGHDQPAPAERPTMTVEECEARGTVVGDIGDGAVHRPDYVCPNGEPPIGTVPSGIEGAVCCPAPAEPAEQ